MARDPLSTSSDDSLALRLVEIFRRRALLAVAVFAMVLGAAISFALYLPDLYRSTALVLVERSISESIGKTPVSGELESRLYVIKQEILSRDKLIELIERFHLYPELRQQTGLEDVLSQARNDILVEPAGPEQVSGRTKTVSFTLSYTGDSPEKVADVTNAVAAFYVQQNDRMRSDEAIRTSEFLRTQLADAKRQLDRHESGLRDYTTRYTGQLPEQVGVNLATLDGKSRSHSRPTARLSRTLGRARIICAAAKVERLTVEARASAERRVGREPWPTAVGPAPAG